MNGEITFAVDKADDAILELVRKSIPDFVFYMGEAEGNVITEKIFIPFTPGPRPLVLLTLTQISADEKGIWTWHYEFTFLNKYICAKYRQSEKEEKQNG